VRARDGTQPGGLIHASEDNEFCDIGLVAAAGFQIGDVGEPFGLRGNIGERAELGRS
jgi:hypothetical protein